MIRLIVQADDFGMCHAVNAGILRACRDGIVTQASAMAPCPWIGEAMTMAAAHRIPIGVHCTLTCEWEHLRWGPITPGPSLRGPDGGFWRTVEEAQAHAIPEEARAELRAQADRLLAASLDCCYVDTHMGTTSRDAFEDVCSRYGLSFMYPIVEPAFTLDSISHLSENDPRDKHRWLLDYIDALRPGIHFLCSHPGESSAELCSVTSPASDNYRWAEEIRAGDLEVLCSPKVRRAIETRGIELISAADIHRERP
jgi:predicted glycoside hydrolase/deacetylase ChbG (UPF0249 family)